MSEQPPDLESPIEALCPRPLHLLTIEELRVETQRIRQLRDNRQAFGAMVRRAAKGDNEPTPGAFAKFL